MFNTMLRRYNIQFEKKTKQNNKARVVPSKILSYWRIDETQTSKSKD